MNILFIGGSSEIAIKIAKKIKQNVYSISRKKNIRYYKKNIQIKNYSENKLNSAFKKLKSINFQSVFIFNGYHKTSLLSFFNESLFDKIIETNLKIPIKITNFLIKNNHINKDGSINFIDRSVSPELLQRGILSIQPQEGEMYLWPSSLLHCVYPFLGDEVRRSIAWNGIYRLVNEEEGKIVLGGTPMPEN